MRATPKLVLVVAVLSVIGAGTYFYLQKSANVVAEKQSRNAVQTVKTAVAVKKSIQVSVQANGYVAAINTIDVRTQVQNVVRQVHVKEGQDVNAGQLLFTLDDRGDTATLEKTRAQVDRDRADLAEAQANLKRNQELFAKGFVAQAVVDSARNKTDSLRSILQADLAGLQGNQVSLGFNRISAGISGRLGTISVHPGSLAQPSGLSLVTISQLDPIAVSFAIPESNLAYVRSSYPKGDAPVTVKLAGGKELKGKLIFIDNNVDASTGTIKMKAQFANPDKLLWPGAFVSVSMITHTLDDVVAIPPQAVVTGPNDKFVYLVQADNSVKRQKVDIGAIEDGYAAVEGLTAGERVVIEGAQNIRPNSKVKEMVEDAAKSGRGKNGGSRGGSKDPALNPPAQ